MEHYHGTNAIVKSDGVYFVFGQKTGIYDSYVAKSSSGTLRVLPVLASYDESGRLIEVYTSDVQEFVKGDNRAISAGPIETGTTVKAFLWNADTMQPLCEAFIK